MRIFQMDPTGSIGYVSGKEPISEERLDKVLSTIRYLAACVVLITAVYLQGGYGLLFDGVVLSGYVLLKLFE